MAAAAKPAPIKLKPGQCAQLSAEHLILLALGKSCYKRSDALLEALLLQVKPGQKFKLTKRALGKKQIARVLRDALGIVCATLAGKTYTVRDKFADRNAIAVGQNARRYELDEVEA